MSTDRYLHIDFVMKLGANPDRPGFDAEVYEQTMLEQMEHHALDTVQQMLSEGSAYPKVWVEHREQHKLSGTMVRRQEMFFPNPVCLEVNDDHSSPEWQANNRSWWRRVLDALSDR